MARLPETIEARQVLSKWYGPDSMVCDTVTRISVDSAEARFRVSANLCSPRIRPPMFDLLKRFNGEFTTKAGNRDAWQHFIDSVGIKVIPGHNITGLVAEALANKRPNYQMIGFDFMRFKGLVLPGQEISFSGAIEERKASVCATLTMRGERRPFTKNFQIEETEPYYKRSGYQLSLPKHWLFEHNAQALGLLGLNALVGREVVPVLMESGTSYFTKIPIVAGDTLITHLKVLASDEQQLLGNATNYLGSADTQIGEEQEILLQFVPMEEIRAAIERAKQ